jgi:hypothetical protein
MTNPKRGMILDRGLTPDLLDVAFRIAADGSPWKDKRKHLTTALLDHVSPQEAEGKTKKCLTRVWINPPEPARSMIRWALEHQHLAADPRVLHMGALLATFPFFGGVTRFVGRQIALEGDARPADARRWARDEWGDRSVIDIGARKAYTTLLALGVLRGGGRLPLTAGEQLAAGPDISGWLQHAVLLGRGIGSMETGSLAASPELFWVSLAPTVGEYPELERHSEGGRRVVLAAR